MPRGADPTRPATLPVISPVWPGRMSALSTRQTRLPYRPTTSQHCLTTAMHSSQSPSRVVNIESVRFGRPDSRTTAIAAATAAETDPESSAPPNSPLPAGATENATNMPPR